MRTLGWIALAGAAAGFLMCTRQGQKLMQQAGDMSQDTVDTVRGWVNDRTGVRKVVHEVVDTPHPDTAMAHAFEEAVA
jgi:hypothetical protein